MELNRSGGERLFFSGKAKEETVAVKPSLWDSGGSKEKASGCSNAGRNEFAKERSGFVTEKPFRDGPVECQ
ncbi:hypothetical protein AC623_01830 [Bacillus sp. FJAT-27231]|uniref:hypothetical protein n=1 Tax=Bacillus sp. FJAT-27231 TaxID=1679168 RepID=UPI000670E056|nr:hypothetical protein [Bacillus sp. FJAT-27231]KMY52873.1 hypothetical protein AC623_01830 [Bacillus sp. FJAT-27231]